MRCVYYFHVANIGGAFGLCLGASIISFIEILYFIVVRVIGRILMRYHNMTAHSTDSSNMATQQIQTISRKDAHFGGYIR